VNAAFPGCPACEGASEGPVATKGPVVLWQCRDCTLVFTHPQSISEVERKYLEEYDLAAHFDAVAPRKRVLFSRRLDLLRDQQFRGRRLCDVGCAGGQFLDLASAEGWETFGIEMNPPAVVQARATGATVVQGRLEDLQDLPWRSFDVVTCWDTLEHTPTPRLFASRLADLLAPGGLLVVTTLNWNSLVRRLLGMRWSMIADEHFTYWTDRALSRLLKHEGMRQLCTYSFGLGRDLVWPLDRLATRTRVGHHQHGVAAEMSAIRRWDSRPVVLTVENAVNRVLRITGAGIGLCAVLRKN
jgi:2-polyprenyl-3-methyl-5-hydroxy-6-metoxy-1,4-benzoquinol methylase